ncbi:hypothetical protein [Sphingomonas sp. CV7422]|uniref:hypothetical protein n=1 Tax=Sphingomonas sp. CV7422 TaxID=3018036 RepID=UPI0022FE173A|nr:hypothetical protein [Sphingomonas sp. CV7422]
MAGALVSPSRPEWATAQGERGTNGIGSICAIVSPGIAAHGMAQAEGGIFLVGAWPGVSAQSIVADAIGVAAIAIVSHSGPSLTSIITARTTIAAVRAKRKNGTTRSDMPAS